MVRQCEANPIQLILCIRDKFKPILITAQIAATIGKIYHCAMRVNLEDKRSVQPIKSGRRFGFR